MKRKVLFLGETYRADAITWMNGLREFGDFDIITWELQTPSNSFKNRVLRILEYMFCVLKIRKIIANEKPDIVIAERATSYGFLAALSGAKIIVIAQQGSSDLWPENSILYPIKKNIQNYAFKKATLIHAWGEVMVPAIIAANVPRNKILVLQKGIDLRKFLCPNVKSYDTIKAIVTRSLLPEYGHECILNAFSILKSKNIPFELTIVGDGKMRASLEKLAVDLEIAANVHFLGRIAHEQLPSLLNQNNFYISMAHTEGVSASLFEAMACKCYPIVSKIPGNSAFVKLPENGVLVPVGDSKTLAEAFFFALDFKSFVRESIAFNLELVHNKANYKTNMTIIAKKYHDLINQNLL